MDAFRIGICMCCFRWQWRVDWPSCAELQIRTSWLSDDATPKVEDGTARRISFDCIREPFETLLFDLTKKWSATSWGCASCRVFSLKCAQVTISAHLRQPQAELAYCRAVCRLKQQSVRVQLGLKDSER